MISTRVRLQLLARVEECSSRLLHQAERAVAFKRSALQALERGLGNPRHAIEAHVQRLDGLSERLDISLRGSLERRGQTLAALGAQLSHPRHAIEALTQRLTGLSERLQVSSRGSLERRSQMVTTLGARLRHPLQQVHDMRRHLENQGRALDAGFRRTVDAAHARFRRLGDLLESYSYRGVLERGFALVTNADGHAIGAAGEAKPGKAIAIEFHDGKVAATVEGATAKPKPARPEPKAGSQGQLF